MKWMDPLQNCFLFFLRDMKEVCILFCFNWTIVDLYCLRYISSAIQVHTHMYVHIYCFSDSFPLGFIGGCWKEFPVLHGRPISQPHTTHSSSPKPPSWARHRVLVQTVLGPGSSLSLKTRDHAPVTTCQGMEGCWARPGKVYLFLLRLRGLRSVWME